jgi:hypothetical protein
MRKQLLLFAAIALVAGTSCQRKVDVKKEKEAIMRVIQTESETARDGNFERLAACYIQDEYNTRLNYSQDSYKIITGWDQVKPLLESFKGNAGQDFSNIKITKDNAIIKVMGNTAWLICDNIWKGIYEGAEIYSDNIQITFLEKVDGEWKISFAAWLTKPEPKVAEEIPDKTE